MEINYSVWFGEESWECEWVHVQQVCLHVCIDISISTCINMHACTHVFTYKEHACMYVDMLHLIRVHVFFGACECVCVQPSDPS